ncbi:MAG TPA: phosphohistidine phosphatase SixA [Chthonomonadales bacterium]|nr:phosphohistidine phosphatase SixA [Chthonomonadales bacterium]
MKLYFLRHGVAEDAAPGQSDAERRLTPEGAATMKEEAAAIRRLNLKLQAIVTSPLPRASETARIVAQALGDPGLVRSDPRLAWGFGLVDLQDLLAGLEGLERVMLVGHQPSLGAIAGALAGASPIDIKKGGLCRLSTARVEPGAAVLEWLLPPSVLALAGGKR